jgi:hypothetical protein
LPLIDTVFHRFGSAVSNPCLIRGPASLPLLRLVTNSKDYLTARVTSRHLFPRLHRFLRWEWSRRALAPKCSGTKAGHLRLLRLGFRMKGADPFSTLLNPHTSAVVRAGYVLAVSGRLHLRLVGHDSHLRMREDHLDV